MTSSVPVGMSARALASAVMVTLTPDTPRNSSVEKPSVAYDAVSSCAEKGPREGQIGSVDQGGGHAEGEKCG